MELKPYLVPLCFLSSASLLLPNTGHHQRFDYYARYFWVRSKDISTQKRRNCYVQLKLCYTGMQFKTFFSRRLIFSLGHLSFKGLEQVFWLLHCPVVGHSILGWSL
jgi:hypothetical protein